MIISEKGVCDHCQKVSFPLYECIIEGKVVGKLCESCSMKVSEIKVAKEEYSL